MQKKSKKTKVKPRIKVAPPSNRHKSVKDYDRKKEKKINQEDSYFGNIKTFHEILEELMLNLSINYFSRNLEIELHLPTKLIEQISTEFFLKTPVSITTKYNLPLLLEGITLYGGSVKLVPKD